MRFALDIDGVRVAEHVTQRAFAYGVADRLARARDGFEQQPKIRIEPVLALAANQIVRKRKLHALVCERFVDDLADVARKAALRRDLFKRRRASRPVDRE